MSDLYLKIVNKIIRNKISTTEVADCLGKKGYLDKVKALNRGHFRCGKIFLAYGYNESNWEIHEQVRAIKRGDIVLIMMHDCKERAAFGGLVSKYILLYQGASAIVVDGYVRDVHVLLKENYPLWCKGTTPIGCFNRKNEKEIDTKILEEWKNKYEEGIAVCDDGGVVIIPREEITEKFFEKLDFIELQEDIWAYCINTKKWDTYDTVCLKKYLDTELLPKELKDKFKVFLDKLNKK